MGTTNAILTEQQRNDVKDLLSDCQIELKSLESDISKAQLHLAALQDRHTHHLSRVQKLHIAISPPKYVPLGVLTSILLYSFDSAEIPPPKSGILPGPWSLSQVCSSWRVFVLGEPRFWTRISFYGDNRDMPMLNEVLKRSGKLKLDFQASDAKKDDMIAKIVFPLAKARRLRYLSLNITPKRMKDILSLPAGSLGALVEVTLTTDNFEKMRREDIHVFDNAKDLRKVTFETDCYGTPPFPSFPLALNWPWPQLTSLNFETLYMNVKVAHEIVNLCPNLREVYVLFDD